MAGCPLRSGELVIFNANAAPDDAICMCCIRDGNTRYNESTQVPDIPPNIFNGKFDELTEHTITQISRPGATALREVTIDKFVSCSNMARVIISRESFVINCPKKDSI